MRIITTISDLRNYVDGAIAGPYYDNPEFERQLINAVAGLIRDEAHAEGLTYGQDWSEFLDRFDVIGAADRITDQN